MKSVFSSLVPLVRGWYAGMVSSVSPATDAGAVVSLQSAVRHLLSAVCRPPSAIRRLPAAAPLRSAPGTIVCGLALLTAVLACSLPSPGGTEVPSGGEVFRDDFSDSSSGWDEQDFPEGVTGYLSGQYQIQVTEPNYDVWGNPDLGLSDVIIEVDGINNDGTEDNSFGVMCRYNDETEAPDFYQLIISSDGYYGIGKVKDGEGEFLSGSVMEFSEAINLGGASNHIRAECIGDTFTLWANGELLAQASDSDFTSGNVGLIAGAFDTPGADVVFDNFVVRKP